MPRGLILAGALGAALLVMGLVAAQEPTSTPTAPPTSTQTPGPTPASEPEFNFDEVKEVVVPLIGDDGRTHYVTLSEDTAGVVRIRLSLFDFPPGSYAVALHRDGQCPSLSYIFEHWSFEHAGGSLVLHFRNTTQVSLLPGHANSIYDHDGTGLSVSWAGPQLPRTGYACAVLAGPPGAPGTGSGVERQSAGRPVWEIAAGMTVVAAGLGVVWALRQRPR